jgi:hypothetical protein
MRKGGDTNVRVGSNFSNNRANRGGIWIRGHRRGFSGNCEAFVLRLPGDVRDLFHLWLERQRRTIIPELEPKALRRVNMSRANRV